MGSAFTYNGHLVASNSPAVGVYDFRFGLFDTATAGNRLGVTLTHAAVPVSNGVFTVSLDFGPSAFSGATRWLEVEVRPNGSTGEFTTLAPRQEVTPTPYALYAAGAGTALSASNLLQALPDGLLSTNVARLDSSPRFAGTITASGFQGDGAGVTNLSLAALGLGDAISRQGYTLDAELSVDSGGGTLMSVTTADLNGDGWTDLIATSRSSGSSLTLFTNDGHGRFQQSGILSSALSARWTIAADLNRDGFMELITGDTDAANGRVTIFTNDGVGRFAAYDVYTGKFGTEAIATADFNGDGWPDLATASRWSDALTVLTNDRAGNFRTATNFLGVLQPRRVVAADVNRDGWMDLLGGGQMWTNNGSGRLISAGGAVDAVTSADFNRDGWVDVVNLGSVMTNNTRGGWASSATLPSGLVYVAVSDINNDGWEDVVGVNSSAHTLTVLTNNQQAAFGLATVLAVGPGPFSAAAADLDGDGRADLVSSDSGTSRLSVLLQTPVQFIGDFFGRVTGSGGGLTNVPAQALVGTVADARLSTNVALLSGDARFIETVTASSFSGDGSGLLNVKGTLPWQVVTGATQIAVPNHGYVASSATQVVITLPASPAVGDIVRVAGAGPGGWRIAQNYRQALRVRPLGHIGPSRAWTETFSSMGWRRIVSSAEGKRLAALANIPGYLTPTNAIYTSSDAGATWTQRDVPRSWSFLSTSADGMKLFAVADGQLYASTDGGASWTTRGPNQGWSTVFALPDGVGLYAVAGGQLYASTNAGAGWSPRGPNQGWGTVVSSADGARLAAVADNVVFTSADAGVSWTKRSLTNRYGIQLVSSADGRRLDAGLYLNTKAIQTSDDYGATWTVRVNVGSSQRVNDMAMSGDGSKHLAVLRNGPIYISTDSGVTWTTQSGTAEPAVVAISTDGSRMVVAESTSYIATSEPSTTPGSGGYIVGDADAAVELQFIGNGQFRVLSFVGSLEPY